VKVTLIYPGISGIGFNSYGRGSEGSWISHGLCMLSGYAKEHGYPVNLIDLRALKSWEHFTERIKSERPDVVGITMMSVDYQPAVQAIDIIKEVSPETKVVVGGPHPSLMLHTMTENPKIDYVVTKEGEISFVKLLKDIEDNKADQRVIVGEAPDLDALPYADRDLFPHLESPLASDEFSPPFVTIIAGRGCLYKCSFCQPAERSIFGKNVRRRSVKNVIGELSLLRERYNFKSWMLHDDCITEDTEWVTAFCEEYAKAGFTQPFACQSRSDIICRHEAMVKKMADVGLKLFFIGFESGNQRVLNFLRKGSRVEHNYKSAEICRKYGIKVWANYMMGMPTETKEEVLDTVNMIRSIKPDFYSPAFYTPHPGSDLYDYCIEHDLMIDKGPDGYRRNPTEEKIKGVDYKFLRRAMEDSIGIPHGLGKFIPVVKPFLNRFPRLKRLAYKVVRGSSH
jgi:anaerobic magnesium-protoporphyrin IX monomethyl ester cyclase